MRWYVDNCDPPEPKIGDTKKEKSFLWLPVTIDDETRWLEIAEIIYVYTTCHRSSQFGFWESKEWQIKSWGNL